MIIKKDYLIPYLHIMTAYYLSIKIISIVNDNLVEAAWKVPVLICPPMLREFKKP